MFINPPPVPIGINPGDHDPIYIELHSKDREQQILNSTIQQGHIQNRGAVLIDDIDKLPLTQLFWINDNRTEISRPVANLLFRAINVDKNFFGLAAADIYELLRRNLSDSLKEKLTNDEKLPFTQQDPDLIALNQSLKFASNMLAILKHFEGPPISVERAAAGAVNLGALPAQVNENLMVLCDQINEELSKHLKEIGPNDPSFDLLLNASNRISDALTLLKNR